MTAPLILDSLEIQGFRGFRHLSIERLGRVNLIVGKNSVGKTALLEALWLYANQGSLSIVWEILEARDERSHSYSSRYLSGPEIKESFIGSVSAIKHLFYGQRGVKKQIVQIPPIRIGPLNAYEQILEMTLIHTDPNKTARLVSELGMRSTIYLLDAEPSPTRESVTTTCIFIPANGLNLAKIVSLWDSIGLTNLEQEVVKSMQVIDRRVERVNLLSDPNLSHDQSRIPKARISGVDEPVALRSLGDGMNRLFGIALALVNAKDGMLLIDEVENGLHYSVQPDVWRLIFETARNLNVQVFATTHSWDCIEAFQKAAEESPEDGLLIRLAERKGEIISDVFSEEELGIATKGQIELR